MQNPDRRGVDAKVALFDVVISMPPGAKLEVIQRLAEIEAGLPPERVQRLIQVLRNTPNAKVATAVALVHAVEEKTRFTKAGLLVEVVPVSAQQVSTTANTEENSYASVQAVMQTTISAELEKKNGDQNGSFFKGKAAWLVGIALAMFLGLVGGGFYLAEKGLSIGGVSLPWAKKQTPPAASTSASGPVGTAAAAVGKRETAVDADVEVEVEVDDSLIQLARTASANVNTNAGAGAGASSVAGAVGSIDTLQKPIKQLLTVEFASLLAEIGQDARAREILKVLAASINPATDAQATAAVDTARIKMQAWSLQRMNGSQARQAVEDLKAKTQAIGNGQARAELQGQIAVILSRNSQLPAEVPRMFLSMGTESLKAIGAGQTSAPLGDMTVSMAEVFLNETTAHAKAGNWTRAKASAAQVENLLKQSPDAWAQTRLYAVDHQAKIQIGQTDKAGLSLASALALVNKNSSLPERALELRNIAKLSEASTQDQFEVVANALQNQLNAKSGIEKARGLAELSLMYTAAGLPGKSAQLRSLAQTAVSLSAADSLAVNIDLKVRNDMAMAKSLHMLGRYAEAEAVLQRVGRYLF